MHLDGIVYFQATVGWAEPIKSYQGPRRTSLVATVKPLKPVCDRVCRKQGVDDRKIPNIPLAALRIKVAVDPTQCA